MKKITMHEILELHVRDVNGVLRRLVGPVPPSAYIIKVGAKFILIEILEISEESQ